MNNFIEIAKQRYSCRSYQPKPLSKEMLEEVLDAARIAPSATNAQPWVYIVVTQEDRLKKIQSCYAREWISTAPAIIVACADHSKSWQRADGKDHADIDLAIGIDHITLAAASLGLATCWVCKFDVIKCASVINLPDNISPVALIPIGFPADTVDPNRHSQKRVALNEIVQWEEFKG